MKKLTPVSLLVVVTGIWFTVCAFAGDFYVIPVKKDSDLVPENIACDIEIFGVKGTLVYDGIACDPIVPKTGQTGCWDESGGSIGCADTGQDGEYQLGIVPAVAPYYTTAYTVPNWRGHRFKDNNDGTVTDNLTGFVWLKQANYKTTSGETGSASWQDALNFCNALQNGQCGLTDGSSAGDWRLPNFNELRSLIDSGETNPALPDGHPFTNVINANYWSSTTYESMYSSAWHVDMQNGIVNDFDKAISIYYVWPVRGGD